MTKKILKSSASVIILFVISALFCFGFFQAVNPFNFTDETDASCFYVIGKAITLGKMPYVDFVDNKGPVTYLLYTLSSFFGKFPWGIMFISIILLFVSLLFIKLICNKLKIKHSFFFQLCFLFVYMCICPAGGYTEDFSIPLILISFFILVCFDNDCSQNKLKWWYGLGLSVLFWLCAMTRVNNAVPIGVIALCTAVKILCEKNGKAFFQYILTAIIGSAIILVPIILWLWKNNALTEFINQCFINNFKYSDSTASVSKADILLSRFGLIAFLLGFCSVLVSVLLCVRNKEKRFTAVTSIISVCITAISLIAVTQKIYHYLLILFAPAYFCSFILLFLVKGRKIKGKTLSISLALIFCALFGASYFELPYKAKDAFYRTEDLFKCIYDNSNYESEYNQKLNALISTVPQEDKDSLFAIDVSPSVYAFTDTTPCKRIFVCCDLFTDISPEYAEEFKGYFENDPPKWLITKVPLNEIYTCELSEKLDSLYSLKEQQTVKDNKFLLYKINEAPK